MRIPDKFGIAVEKNSKIFSPELLKGLYKKGDYYYSGEIPKKIKGGEILLTLSTGAREVRGKTFKLTGCRRKRGWHHNDEKDMVLEFEAVGSKAEA